MNKMNEKNRKSRLRAVLTDPIMLIFIGLLAAVVAAGILAPQIAPNNPDKLDLTAKFLPAGPAYPLGTDNMGRCIFSRLLYGIRPTVGYAALVTAVASVVGTAAGMVSGYCGKAVDRIIMRLCDVLRAFPGIVIVMVVISVLGVGISNVCLAMLITRWVWYARVARNLTRQEKERTSIMAAVMAGSSRLQIVCGHILPAILPQMLSILTINFGSALLSISGYSFLGLGMQPPSAEWGMMISDGKAFISTHPLLMFWPGLCILIVVVSANVLGDRLRDLLEDGRT